MAPWKMVISVVEIPFSIPDFTYTEVLWNGRVLSRTRRKLVRIEPDLLPTRTHATGQEDLQPSAPDAEGLIILRFIGGTLL